MSHLGHLVAYADTAQPPWPRTRSQLHDVIIVPVYAPLNSSSVGLFNAAPNALLSNLLARSGREGGTHMPWDVRGERRYFYHWRRVGGRRTKQYLGSGEAALRVATEIERRRAERTARAQEARYHRQQHTEASAPLEGLTHLTDLLAKGTLIGLGYHQHDRTWRKRRDHPNAN
jgi:hypothetical protein